MQARAMARAAGRLILGFLLTGTADALIGMIDLGAQLRGQEEHYLSRSGKIGRYSYEGMWHAEAGSYELVHIAFVTFGVPYTSVASAGLGHKPDRDGVSSFPDGLYSDGTRVPTGPCRRVFVYTKSREMRVVPLDPDELKLLSPEALKGLELSNLWLSKIEPVLLEEERKAPPELARGDSYLPPVEAPKPN